jgi:hypothetical protein
MLQSSCDECGQDLESGTEGLCKDCKEMAEFLSHFSDEELDEMESNVRKWVNNDCPVPVELASENY